MKRSALVFNLIGGAIVVACSSSGGGGGFTGVGGDSGGGPVTLPTGSGTGMQMLPPVGDSGSLPGNGSGTGTAPPPAGDAGPCTFMDSTDHDGDGWSFATGDCNDCNKFINPGAYDIPGNHIDEDCDGTADNEPTGCDSSLTSVATTSGAEGAKAMDLCRTTTAAGTGKMKTWGVIDAEYVLPDGSSTPSAAPTSYSDGPQCELEFGGPCCTFDPANFGLGFGILGPKYGSMNSVQQGSHALGLSSGTARQPTDPGWNSMAGLSLDKCFVSGAPTGFPGQTQACPGITFGQPHDGAALRLVVRVPTNALTMSFDTNFFSYEFPEWVCSTFNDTFVVIMTPSPAGEPSNANENIAFDSKGNVISVNAGFLRVCDATSTAGGQGMGPGTYSYMCPEGAGKLAGTGFGKDGPVPMGDPTKEDHASTDWLTTTANVAALAGKEITLLFAVWDSTDGNLDTTVLVDNVTWTFATAPNTAPPPPMTPVTLPK